MTTATEIKSDSVQALGDIEADRFIALIQREPYGHTVWRQSLPTEASLDALVGKAMAPREAQGR